MMKDDIMVQELLSIIKNTYEAFKPIVVNIDASHGLNVNYYVKTEEQRLSRRAAFGYLDRIGNIVNINMPYITYHNHVMLYPDHLLVNDCIFTVIHELSHIDQLVDYDLANSNKEYLYQIETANNYNTYRILRDNEQLALQVGYQYDARWIGFLDTHKEYKNAYITKPYVACVKEKIGLYNNLLSKMTSYNKPILDTNIDLDYTDIHKVKSYIYNLNESLVNLRQTMAMERLGGNFDAIMHNNRY